MTDLRMKINEEMVTNLRTINQRSSTTMLPQRKTIAGCVGRLTIGHLRVDMTVEHGKTRQQNKNLLSDGAITIRNVST